MNSENIISMPERFFSTPNELLITEILTKKEKVKALENWKQSCIHKQESTEEGMEGDSGSYLQEVSVALSQLH